MSDENESYIQCGKKENEKLRSLVVFKGIVNVITQEEQSMSHIIL